MAQEYSIGEIKDGNFIENTGWANEAARDMEREDYNRKADEINRQYWSNKNDVNVDADAKAKGNIDADIERDEKNGVTKIHLGANLDADAKANVKAPKELVEDVAMLAL